ncbi:hypothetical protein SDC9_200650 [bioreactor metagenome]|uniref:Uncharacterized protein n=1 Tax=bioreactor metagenome TaxID=1076179 RepID=A0A645IP22_9ZZZZ
MGKVHHAHHAKNQCEANGHQKVEQPDDEAIGQRLTNQKSKVHGGIPDRLSLDHLHSVSEQVASTTSWPSCTRAM